MDSGPQQRERYINPHPGALRAPTLPAKGGGKDYSPPLLVIRMHLDLLPDAVDLVRVAVGEGVDGGAVLGLDDEERADRRLAVVGHHRPRGHHLDRVFLRLVEMDAVIAIKLGAGVDRVLLVHGVNDEEHEGLPALNRRPC